MRNQKCGTCRFWEITYPENANLGDHASGTCDWLSMQIKPCWLKSEDAIIQAFVLSGSGRKCEAWQGKLDPEENVKPGKEKSSNSGIFRYVGKIRGSE